MGSTTPVNASLGSYTLVSASFTAPANNSSSTTNKISITLNVPAASPVQDVKLFIVARSAQDSQTSDVVSEVKTISLSGSAAQNVTFDNVSLLYPENYLYCRYEKVNPNIPNDGSDDSGPCGPGSMVHVTYIPTDSYTTLFRFWSNAKQVHFYTTNVAERDNIIANDPSWSYEGPAYKVGSLDNSANCKDTSMSKVYRFWNPSVMHHFYTINEEEKNGLISGNPNWDYEGVGFCATPNAQSGLDPIYRFYSDSKKSHFFTINEAEKNEILTKDPSWTYETIAYYAKN